VFRIFSPLLYQLSYPANYFLISKRFRFNGRICHLHDLKREKRFGGPFWFKPVNVVTRNLSYQNFFDERKRRVRSRRKHNVWFLPLLLS